MALNFPYSGFYPYDDDPNFETNLVNNCALYSINDLNMLPSNENSLFYLHLNCRSLHRNEDQVNSFIASLNLKSTVLFFSETWFNCSSCIQVPPGYNAFHCFRCQYGNYNDSLCHKRGGVSIYVSDNVTSNDLLLPDLKKPESFEFISRLVATPPPLFYVHVSIGHPIVT